MIKLRKNADRRVRRGHSWVFSNEVADPPVSTLEAGAVHELVDHAGEFMAMVYANPTSLITARVLSRKKRAIDEDFFEERLRSAIEWRNRFLPDRDACRLVFSEADHLPGLVVDRYGTVLAVQSLTTGIDRFLPDIVDALVRIVSPVGIFLRNDSSFREMEGLSQEKRAAYGIVPDLVEIRSRGLTLLVDVPNGQKTGFFVDQESNRDLMARYVSPGARVLDLFCYTSAWGMHALAAGAAEVTAVDSSRSALDLAGRIAERNGFEERFRPVKDSVIDFLKKHKDTWDVILLDPPAFIKSRAGIKDGLRGYIDVNRRALGKLESGGVLVTCSCSHHLDAAEFEAALLSAAVQSGRDLRLLEIRGQGPDHPVLLAMPETRYLKVIVAQVV